MIPHVYISFVGIERNNDQTFKFEELNKWIEENIKKESRNYAKWGIGRPPFLVGIYLYPEQATLFRLKFGYDFL
jgi:hypothetical protein